VVADGAGALADVVARLEAERYGPPVREYQGRIEGPGLASQQAEYTRAEQRAVEEQQALADEPGDSE